MRTSNSCAIRLTRYRSSQRSRDSESMPLNPKIEQVLELIARAKRPPYHEVTAHKARASYEKSAPILEIPSARMFAVEDLKVPMRDGATIRARLYQPAE